MLQVLLAEDHNIVRNGIKLLLEQDAEIKIAGELENGKEVLDFIANENAVDIVLADINMPEMDGITLIKELKQAHPQIDVVILSMHDNEKYIAQAFLAGAKGYLLKNVNADELLFALKHISMGAKYICSELSLMMLDKVIISNQSINISQNNIDFSLREIEILNLLGEGLTNSEMAEKLFISKRTIEGHRQSLIEKTGVKNSAALIRFAVLNGIIQ
ncbi:response regulator transcription factor [Pedobacter insulae]|uniref:DNA-binding response regulator, NarL/FixJ family, contains REC and HTH domains n=1 Tax=Pedobacter insulae TaxID=414048 RepID=A0A1I2V1S0_9SPHI|nr:response regulator transcription factor [Pedobacter insulae]SFG82107.1 DNA-binding response regulator, NarL/FixJ family, contains REC and HTH domains [Pedobacter insulae]